MLGSTRTVRSGILALALVLQGGLLVAGQSIGVCDHAPSTSCSAYSSLNIRVTSGSCSGEASANCEAITSTKQAYSEAFAEWIGDTPEDRCSTGKADAAAESVAQAIAEVYTSALVNVQCEGVGEACGFAVGDGAAFAESTAEAAAIAAAEAGAGLAFCYADIRGLASVLSEAVATAQTDACSTGGSATAIAEAIASQVKTAVAQAFALATAESCGGSNASASSKCTGSASSSGSESLGDRCAGIILKEDCAGRAASVCCDPSYKSAFCACPGCGGRLTRVKNGQNRSFVDSSGHQCLCRSTSGIVNARPVSPPSEECSCTNVQPSEEFSCDEQKSFGKCDSNFMVEGKFCEESCGRCTCSDDQPTTPTTPPTPPTPPSQGCSCTDVPPSEKFSCDEQKSFGKCNAKFMVDGNFCEETCGRCTCSDDQPTPPPAPSPTSNDTPPEGCQCTDVKSPSSKYSCEEQRDFGKCNEDWMVGYCQVTCGSCSCSEQQPPSSPTPNCTCSDIEPAGSPYSCKEQREFGKCFADWMVNGGFCDTTCGRCSCPGSPAPPELEIDASGKECICSDQPPPCSDFPCEQQRGFGKCMADWMLVTNKNPDGHCQITCGRCPCSDPKIRPQETQDYTCTDN